MTHRVLTALFAHETNTFSKLPTTLDNYRDYVLAFGDDIPDAIAGSVLELVGVENAAERHGWNLVHTVAAWATPSGPVAREVWDAGAGAIMEAAATEGPFDGVVLCLHGAMTTVDHADAEGELLARLRERIGPDVPVAITLDLHANVTRLMAKHANIICAYRTYPHVDQVETAERASDILARAMAGEVTPRVHLARRPMLVGLDHGRTTTENPMTRLLERAEKLEAGDPGVLAVSLQAGFSPADFAEVGPSIAVTGAGDDPRYRTIAEAFMNYAWENRHFDSNEYLGVAEVLTRLAEIPGGAGPVVIADASDNPGAGSYGDSTLLLQGMIEAGLDNAAFGTICDPESAGRLVAAGVGNRAAVTLGGKIDPAYGAPLELEGEVMAVTEGSYVAQGPRWRGVTQNLGPTAIFRVGSVDIVVASKRVQCTELETFTHAGIDPAAKDVVAVKSMHHFRAAFEPIARAVLVVDSGALATKDYHRLPYENLRRPIFPLDMD